MNTYAQVTALLDKWRSEGRTKVEIIVALAEACLGWSYVWGGYGQQCTVANRKSYADRTTCPTAEAEVIRKKCQRLRPSSSLSSCAGCKWYPGGVTLFFDCRGFTRWVLARVGVTLVGAGATSQWNTASNWAEKGVIADMPKDAICCVFKANGRTMEHTGLYIGKGRIIHCSGEVKEGKPSDRGWTHYAIPKGIEGGVPVVLPTLRKGSRGEYVTLLQTKLIQRGYDLSPYGADGSFGNKTFSAVKEFQSNNGLVSDGVVGSRTWEALNSGKTTLYTVNIQHLGANVANEIVKKYGGTMTVEE